MFCFGEKGKKKEGRKMKSRQGGRGWVGRGGEEE